MTFIKTLIIAILTAGGFSINLTAEQIHTCLKRYVHISEDGLVGSIAFLLDGKFKITKSFPGQEVYDNLISADYIKEKIYPYSEPFFILFLLDEDFADVTFKIYVQADEVVIFPRGIKHKNGLATVGELDCPSFDATLGVRMTIHSFETLTGLSIINGRPKE